MQMTNIFNPFMIWLLRSPFHKLASKNTLLITFVGSKSRKSYTTPVNYVLDGEVLYIISMRRRIWWKNLRGCSKFSIRLEGKDLEKSGEVIEDEDSVVKQLTAYLRKVPQYAGNFKVNLDEKGQLDPDNINMAAKERVVIRINLK